MKVVVLTATLTAMIVVEISFWGYSSSPSSASELISTVQTTSDEDGEDILVKAYSVTNDTNSDQIISDLFEYDTEGIVECPSEDIGLRSDDLIPANSSRTVLICYDINR